MKAWVLLTVRSYAYQGGARTPIEVHPTADACYAALPRLRQEYDSSRVDFDWVEVEMHGFPTPPAPKVDP